MPQPLHPWIKIALCTLASLSLVCAPSNRGPKAMVPNTNQTEALTVDPVAWGTCQTLVVPAGVVVGKQPLVKTPAVAPRCLPAGSALSRTLQLLQSSTPQRRHRVRILYYGQSITRDGFNAPNEWFRSVTNWLQAKYPYADIETQMLAVGGFDAKAMQGPSRMDLPAFYPDLILWQNYGKYPDMDQTLTWWRTHTSAEIGIHNWHCGGSERKVNSDKNVERMAYIYIPDLANRFGAELIDLRTPWRKRWNEEDTDRKQLTIDEVHLGTVGSQWYAEFTEAYLTYDPKVPVDPLKMVQTLIVGKDVQWNGKTLKFSFQGNRIEVLAKAEASATDTAEVRIDNKKPSEFASAYVFSRPNGDVDRDWPWKTSAPAAVDTAATPLLEDWTLTIQSIEYPQKRASVACAYSVAGMLSGQDGTGTCESDFVSKSGRVVIPATAWAHLWDAKNVNSKKTLAIGDTFKWKALPLHTDRYPVTNSEKRDPTREHWTLLASGIPNGKHTLELTATGDHAPQIAEIRVYRPPLGREWP
jgi:hypothetical protein